MLVFEKLIQFAFQSGARNLIYTLDQNNKQNCSFRLSQEVHQTTTTAKSFIGLQANASEN